MKKEKTKMKKKTNVEKVVEKSGVISEETFTESYPPVVTIEVPAPVEDEPNSEPTPVEVKEKNWFGKIVDKVKVIIAKIKTWSLMKKWLVFGFGGVLLIGTIFEIIVAIKK